MVAIPYSSGLSFLHFKRVKPDIISLVAIPYSSGLSFLQSSELLNKLLNEILSQSLIHQVLVSYSNSPDAVDPARLSQSLIHQVLVSYEKTHNWQLHIMMKLLSQSLIHQVLVSYPAFRTTEAREFSSRNPLFIRS